MVVRKGTKVHPATFGLVLRLKDRWGFTYDDLSDLLEVTPSRVQQIVLQQRKQTGEAHAYTCPGCQQAEERGATLT